MSPTAASSSHHRRPSRSNSTSSSVVTVRKTVPMSSRSAHRTSHTKARPTSPDRLTAGPRDFLSPTSRSRPGSSTDSKGTPNPNINRWSHSTSSSISALDTDATRYQANVSARRMSIGLSTSKLVIPEARNDSLSRAPTNGLIVNSKQAPGMSPEFKLPTLQKQASSTDSLKAMTPQITPTSMFNTTSSSLDYFGEVWQPRRGNNKSGDHLTALPAQQSIVNSPNRRKRDNDSDFVSSQDEQHENDHPSNNSRSPNGHQSSRSEGSRRSHRSPTQKTMLSKALAKANTAVLFDNSQNIEGAIEAYAEACDLLQQVMVRSSDMEDRKKLSAIRSTYSNRIAELHDLDDSFSSLMEKALPEDPPTDESNPLFFAADGTPIEPTATEILEQVHIPPRQESLLPQIFGGDRYLEDPSMPSKKQMHANSLAIPMESQHMPPPLSPRRIPSPGERDFLKTNVPVVVTQEDGDINTGSLSWLDTIDDADSASRSLSEPEFEAGRNHETADQIEAEFDAALNAAVDAAYDTDTGQEATPRPEKQIKPLASIYQGTGFQNNNVPIRGAVFPDDDFEDEYDDDDDDDDAEEERILDEVTQGFIFDDFHFDRQSKSALPRQSDSSTFSGQTWGSSVPSTSLTSGTALSTLNGSLDSSKQHQSTSQAKTTILPPAKPSHVRNPSVKNQPAQVTQIDQNVGSALRDRRLSGQSAKRLKIETFVKPDSISRTDLKGKIIDLPKIDVPNTIGNAPHTAPLQTVHAPSSTSTVGTQPATPLTSVHSSDSIASESPATPALTQGGSQGSVDDSAPTASSPSRLTKRVQPSQPPIKQTSSFTNLGNRNLLGVTTETNESPLTPGSVNFPDVRKAVPPLPTPVGTSFSLQGGGMYLFEDPIATSTSSRVPGSPNLSKDGGPAPLEPCPESFLLRPFWLMRCLYQTLAHPRGGYISTKLFIPRDIWRVKNAKIKLIDDKVFQCDLLTAALMKLSKVDNLDAEAVLEELQSFETILEQVRIACQKKLGGEVGLSSSSNIFKPSGADENSEPVNSKSSNSNSTTKSFASSWRKLRSKSSTSILTMNSINGNKDPSISHTPAGLTMSSLPMTSSTFNPSSRNQYRSRSEPPTPTQLTNIPIAHATYMASLARLFDAVQILDSIGRQVVDPGLKCSSKTHVGLEFSVRNAAEFFAFYIIRFVMADIGVLVDKFLKRGTEWVLA